VTDDETIDSPIYLSSTTNPRYTKIDYQDVWKFDCDAVAASEDWPV